MRVRSAAIALLAALCPLGVVGAAPLDSLLAAIAAEEAAPAVRVRLFIKRGDVGTSTTSTVSDLDACAFSRIRDKTDWK